MQQLVRLCETGCQPKKGGTNHELSQTGGIVRESKESMECRHAATTLGQGPARNETETIKQESFTDTGYPQSFPPDTTIAVHGSIVEEAVYKIVLGSHISFRAMGHTMGDTKHGYLDMVEIGCLIMMNQMKNAMYKDIVYLERRTIRPTQTIQPINITRGRLPRRCDTIFTAMALQLASYEIKNNIQLETECLYFSKRQLKLAMTSHKRNKHMDHLLIQMI